MIRQENTLTDTDLGETAPREQNTAPLPAGERPDGIVSGVLVVDKPEGWTSFDVLAKLRGALHTRRLGHGGTLDPLATGVLPVFVGRATRAAELCAAADKDYLATLRLGLVTDTQDVTGHILEERPASVTDGALAAAAARFTGEISQLPPMYSAVKIGGKKLYELARQGKTAERTPRRVTVSRLEVLDRQGDLVRLAVTCSKGTYVRTLCHDIGESLGCGGCMSALRRTRAGTFSLAQAATLEELLARPLDRLRGIDSLFSDRPAVTAAGEAERRVRNGNDYPAPELPEGQYRVYGENGAFLMLGECRGGRMVTVKSFFEVL